MTINDNILSITDGFPDVIMQQIASRVKEIRLAKNLTQKALALRTDVSFASYRRFERTGEIAFRSLVMLGIVLDMSEDFNELFVSKSYQSIQDLVLQKSNRTRKRGALNE